MFDIIYNKLLKSYNHFDRNNVIDRGVMAERVNILKTDDNEYILDIGEIEIVDKTGKIIKPKEKIPTLLFKKTVYVVLADKGIKYNGWVEDYPGGIKALRELEKYFKSVK